MIVQWKRSVTAATRCPLLQAPLYKPPYTNEHYDEQGVWDPNYVIPPLVYAVTIAIRRNANAAS